MLFREYIILKTKYFDYNREEYSTSQELKMAYYYIEYPNKKDYVNILHLNSERVAAEHEYKTAKLIYNSLKKIFKDSDISSIGMIIVSDELRDGVA